ncbi:MAG TPA: MFS transporter [Candidatus Binataceae bacterium]|nr:MFS transporter [Candidatus Binataceae bacterium]
MSIAYDLFAALSLSSMEAATKTTSTAATAGGASRLILFLTVFIDLLGFGIVIPFLPLYADRLGVGAAGIGLILASYSAAQLVGAPILGRISDRVGRRPVIMVGLLGSAVGYLIYGFATSFFWLVMSRAVHGICAATVSTAQAYIADTTEESERAHGMGLIGAAFGLGFVLGPGLGGLLAYAGSSLPGFFATDAGLRLPVFFASALALGNFFFAAKALPESHPNLGGLNLGLGELLEPWFNITQNLHGILLRLFSLAFLFTFVFAGLETTFPLLAAGRYGLSPVGIGALFAFAGLLQAIAQGYVLGKIVKRTGEWWLIRGGAIAMAVGLTPLVIGSSHLLLWILLALIAVGYGFSGPSVASLISKSASRQLQGEALGVNQSALSMARIFGPIIAGVLYEVVGAAWPYLGGTLIMLATLALMREKATASEGQIAS